MCTQLMADCTLGVSVSHAGRFESKTGQDDMNVNIAKAFWRLHGLVLECNFFE